MVRSGWPLRYQVTNDNWWEVTIPVRRSLIQCVRQPWKDCQPVHQIHVYMGDDQNHFNNNQTRDNITIGTLNHNVVQDNGTDSQENPIKNNNSNKCIWSGRERNREINSNQHRRKTERIWIHGK